jgi:HEAT repeat protein
MEKCFLVLAVVFFFQFALFAQEQPAEKPAAAPSEADSAKLQEEINSLVKQLGSDDWQTRENATKRLIEIGAPAAAAVTALRTSEDIEVRVRAAKILDAIHWISPEDTAKIEGLISKYVGEPGANEASGEQTAKIDELIKKLSSEDYKTREEATKSLIEIGRPALSAVEKLKTSEDAEVKTRAEQIAAEIIKKSQDLEAEVIKQMKEIKQAVFYLIDRLSTGTTDPQREVKIAEILSGLLNLSSGDNEGDGIVIRGQGQGGVVVIARLKVLGQKGKGRIIINGKEVTETESIKKGAHPAEVLTAILKDQEQNSELRARAARALAARGDKCAVMSLVNVLSDLKGKLQLSTAETLRKLTGEKFGPFENSTPEESAKSVEEWKGWLEKNKEDKAYRFKDQQANSGEGNDELGGMLKRMRKQGALPKEAEELLKKRQGEQEKEKKENPPQKPNKEKGDEKEREF